jgi:hypothetical protein
MELPITDGADLFPDNRLLIEFHLTENLSCILTDKY